MTDILFLYSFNPYHNRRCIRYGTVDEYIQHFGLVANRYLYKSNYNFNSNDGITTTVTLNTLDYNPTMVDVIRPDYLLVINSWEDQEAGESGKDIISRWYVIGCQKTRKGQYTLTLLRDAIADFKNTILYSPTFIEKGYVKDDNPLIFNKEDFTVNQIKTSETLLKDKTNCPWIVGFLSNEKQADWTTTSYADTYTSTESLQYDKTYSNINNYEYKDFIKLHPQFTPNVNNVFLPITSKKILLQYRISTYARSTVSGYTNYYFNYTVDTTSNTISKDGFSIQTSDSAIYSCKINIATLPIATAYDNLYNSLSSSVNTIIERSNIWNKNHYNTHTQDEIATYQAENDKRINIQNTASSFEAGVYKLSTEFRQFYNSTTYAATTSSDAFPVASFEGSISPYKRDLLECSFLLAAKLTPASIELDGAEARLLDAPYKMFAIPYGEVNIKRGNTNVMTTNATTGMAIAQSISSKLSGTWLYDLQLVPYCPFIKSAAITDGTIDLSVGFSAANYRYTDGTNTIIFFPEYSTVSDYAIEHEIKVDDYKVDNQCDMYRLCSPSYDSVFEFNEAMNGGVNNFNVDFVYKPFSSYIHVNPNFGRMYGADYNDARGLICTGDFSLPSTTDQWEQYIRNNVNYEKSFNRQIENLEVTQDIGIKQSMWATAAGAIQGGVSGAVAGGFAGGLGSAVGAVAGTAASLGAGIADISYQKKLNTETIDYTKDQFGYQLGNIKALPNTLSKVSSFTPNNKLFPVLEYYTCTQVEKDAFRNKIKYNGMTVGIIDKPINYINEDDEYYLKGKLIKWDPQSAWDTNPAQNSELIEYISEELNKGIFIKGD